MVDLTKSLLRHFVFFLKKNGLYNEFRMSFSKQAYYPKHASAMYKPLPNYYSIMRDFCYEDQWREELGVLILGLDSFVWAHGNYGIPLEHTRKWCTACLKWALYCTKEKLFIGVHSRIHNLIVYWDNNDWVDPYMLTNEELKICKTFGVSWLCGVKIDDLIR